MDFVYILVMKQTNKSSMYHIEAIHIMVMEVLRVALLKNRPTTPHFSLTRLI